MLVKLECGLEIKAEKEKFDDMRVLEAMGDDNPLAFSKVLNMVLEKAEKEKMYSYLQDKFGRVPVQEFSDLFMELMQKLGEQDKDLKN